MKKRYKITIVVYKTLVIEDKIEEEFDTLTELMNTYSRMLYDLNQMNIDHDSIVVYVSKKIEVEDKVCEVDLSATKLYRHDVTGDYIDLNKFIIDTTRNYNQAKLEEQLVSLTV